MLVGLESSITWACFNNLTEHSATPELSRDQHSFLQTDFGTLPYLGPREQAWMCQKTFNGLCCFMDLVPNLRAPNVVYSRVA